MSFSRNHLAGWAFHLQGKVSPRVYRVGHPVRVRYFVHVNLVQHDLNANAASSLGIIDEDKLPSFTLGKVPKKRSIIWIAFLIIVIVVIASA